MGTEHQRDKLLQLFELARIARGWTRVQLADALGRDPSRLIPKSGNPKLDVVVKLARVLEWPVGDVVEALHDDTWDDVDLVVGAGVDRSLDDQMAGKTPDELYELASELNSTGRHQDCVVVARRIRSIATDAQRLGEAFAAESVSWISTGRYVQGLEAANAGLSVSDLPSWVRHNLMMNLAHSLYFLWRLPLALSLCDLILSDLAKIEGQLNKAALNTKIITTVLRGQVHRRLVAVQGCEHIGLARTDLESGLRMCTTHETEIPQGHLKARAMECSSALLEVAVLEDDSKASESTAKLLSLLDHASSLDHVPAEECEALGWSCIYGCNIALTALHGSERQRAFAIFSNKVLEIADHLDHWAFRERVYCLQSLVHQQVRAETGYDIPMSIDDQEKAVIVATMSRFPQFRTTGWDLLGSGKGSRNW